MGASSRSLSGSAFLLALLAFAYGGICVYSASRDITLAHTEASTAGQARLHPQSKDPSIFDSLRCDYTFMVNGTFYTGHGICPAQTDHSVKGVAENLAGMLQNQSVTVYYDAADPTTNSMIEFGLKRAYDYKKALLSCLAGVVLLIVAGFAAVFLRSSGNASEGVAVDSEGTIIYPDGSGSGG